MNPSAAEKASDDMPVASKLSFQLHYGEISVGGKVVMEALPLHRLICLVGWHKMVAFLKKEN